LGFSILGFGALWFAVDRLGDWSSNYTETLEADLSLWAQAVGLFVLAGVLFGVAVWLPVPGRGGRLSALLGLGIPLLLLNAYYAVIFHVDFEDLPEFLQSRLLVHPLMSFTAIAVAAVFLGVALVSGFSPAGYISLRRLQAQPRYNPKEQPPPLVPPSETPPPPPPPPPAPEGRAPETSGPSGRPDNQATRELPPRDR
jgi:hypothetical protein